MGLTLRAGVPLISSLRQILGVVPIELLDTLEVGVLGVFAAARQRGDQEGGDRQENQYPPSRQALCFPSLGFIGYALRRSPIQ